MENDKLVRLSDVKALFHRGDERTFPFSFPGLVTERDVESIPAVDAVEEKQGFWKVAGTRHPKPGSQRYRKQDKWTVYKCSNCGASNGRNRSDPYCRHCGARMLVDNCLYCYNDGGRREDGDA